MDVPLGGPRFAAAVVGAGLAVVLSSCGKVTASDQGGERRDGDAGSLAESGASDGQDDTGPEGAADGPQTDAGVDAPLPPGSASTVLLTPFAVAPGEEVSKCQVFGNPFGGVDTDVIRAAGTMSKGSRSFFLFNMDDLSASVEPPKATLGDCAGQGLELHPFVFYSQTALWTEWYPNAADGSPMGYPLAGTHSVMIDAHYLNTGSTTLTANASVTLQGAPAGAVHTHVGHVYLFQATGTVPAAATAQSPTHLTATWGGDAGVLPASYSIFASWSHMHRTGVAFSASTGGTTFYTESNWDSPDLFVHMPGFVEPSTATGAMSPVQMVGNPSVTWDCAYANDTGAPLEIGDSALNNVQCVYIGQYYPASTSSPDEIAAVN